MRNSGLWVLLFAGAVWVGLAAPAAAQGPCRGVDCDGAGLCFPERAEATCLCDPGFEARGAHCVATADPDAVDPMRERHRSDVGEEVVALARAQVGLGPYGVGRRVGGDLGPLHEFLAPHEMWCTDFVAWVYRAAGVPFDGGEDGWQVQNNYAARQWYRQRELWVDRDSERWHSFEPRPGDYVRIHTARFGHSAIVDRVEGDTLVLIEGNVGNRVRVGRHRHFRRDTSIDGFGLLALDNAPPVVDAGPEDMIAWDEYSVFVEGTVSDDGPAAQLTTSWSRRQGPGTVTFEDPWAPATWVTFSEPGVYVLQLAADDGALASTDEIVVELALTTLEEPAFDEASLPNPGASCAIQTPADDEPSLAFGLLLVALLLVRRRC